MRSLAGELRTADGPVMPGTADRAGGLRAPPEDPPPPPPPQLPPACPPDCDGTGDWLEGERRPFARHPSAVTSAPTTPVHDPSPWLLRSCRGPSGGLAGRGEPGCAATSRGRLAQAASRCSRVPSCSRSATRSLSGKPSGVVCRAISASVCDARRGRRKRCAHKTVVPSEASALSFSLRVQQLFAFGRLPRLQLQPASHCPPDPRRPGPTKPPLRLQQSAQHMSDH